MSIMLCKLQISKALIAQSSGRLSVWNRRAVEVLRVVTLHYVNKLRERAGLLLILKELTSCLRAPCARVLLCTQMCSTVLAVDPLATPLVLAGNKFEGNEQENMRLLRRIPTRPAI
jgi:hypothetical protein